MSIEGKVWKFGDDINTDVLYPGQYTYLPLTDEQVATHALEGLAPNFAAEAVPGDILVGGWNWGVGSAREQAVKCIKFQKVGAIIAKSFARIYFRNCLNEGLLAIACPAAVDAIADGDVISIDMDRSVIRTGKGEYSFESYPEHVRSLVDAGGIVPYTIQKMKG